MPLSRDWFSKLPGLRSIPVSRSLDKKLTFGGFEVLDLLGLMLVISVLNLLFGSTGMKLYFVWLPSLFLALVLRWGKRGKPDKHLIHLVKFYARPATVSAFQTAKSDLFRSKKKEIS